MLLSLNRLLVLGNLILIILSLYIALTIPKFKGKHIIPLQEVKAASVFVDIIKNPTPKAIVIPSIDLVTKIEIAGKDSKGLMEVPDVGKTVSWYKYGPYPGKNGNSVIAGHYATDSGPAVFQNLSKVQVGNKIEVLNEDNDLITFEVYKTETVKLADFDVAKVYGPSNDTNLNLVTCAGSYSFELDTYTHRFIAYTRLVN